MYRLLLVLLTFLVTVSAEPPTAVDDAWTLKEDAQLIVPAADGLAANDLPGAAANPAIGLTSSPSHGTLVLSPDGAFTYSPSSNYFGPDSFTYRQYGDRPVTAFIIDEPNSTLKLTATLRITFQGVPSISSDSSTSHVSGTISAAVAPGDVPFAVIQVTDLDAVLTDAISLKLGVGCIPILNTCLGGVQFDSEPNALSLGMATAGPASSIRSNGSFDAGGSIFSLDGEGTVAGTEQLEPYLPQLTLPLALPAVVMPFNGRMTASGGLARLEMQINYKGSVAIDASTSLAFGLSGIIKATAPLPLGEVDESIPATVNLTISPVNDAPVARADSYLVKAGTALNVSASGTVATEQLITAGSIWRYNHDASAPAPAWKSWAFVDTTWASGRAELGYGDSGLLGGNRPEITNIRGSAARPTAYFRHEFQATDVNSTRSLTMELLRDDGAAVYLNGIEIARQNLAPGAGHTALAASRIPNADETTFFAEAVPPALLLEGKNVIAVEVHQFSTTDYFSLSQVDPADVSFDLKLSRSKGLTGVLVNDEDVDSTSLAVALHTPPSHGQVALTPDGAFIYTPEAGYSGIDSFIYAINDGGTEDAEIDLITAGSTWKYLDNGSDQGTAWREPSYPDSSWTSGRTEIGYGDANTLDDRPETTTLSYLLVDPPVTTYFRKVFTLPLPKTMLKGLRLRLLRDDGAAVFLNGIEIARDNLPAAATYDTGASLPVEGEAEAQWIDFAVPAAALASLVEGTNVLAVELHQNAFVSNDASFDCQLVAAATPGAKVILTVAADDFDLDQMADTWERGHGLDFSVPDGTEDPDGDGQSNRQEFLADTDPHDRSQYLRITSFSQTGGLLDLRVAASENRHYVLQTSPDFLSWTEASPSTAGTFPELRFTVTPPTTGLLYYRVRVDYQFP